MGMTGRTRKLLGTLIVLAVLGGLGTVLWKRKFDRYTPVEAVLDLQAAAKVRGSARPVEDFLEARYGPMTVPANRQRAFLDFFNVGHIEGMHVIVSHMQPERKQANVQAMAQWLANYRRVMTPEEKAALAAHLRSPSGRAAIQKANVQFLNKDVHFRAATAPVIQELMTTLATVQQP